jgi:hypothetical protein
MTGLILFSPIRLGFDNNAGEPPTVFQTHKAFPQQFARRLGRRMAEKVPLQSSGSLHAVIVQWERRLENRYTGFTAHCTLGGFQVWFAGFQQPDY